MGGDRKSKKKRRSSLSASDSEDGGKTKRRRTGESKSEKKDKSKKKDRDKSHKSSKHRHHSHRDKKSKAKGKHQSKHDKHDGKLKLKFQELSTDDYFSKNNEFATWLKEEKDVFFSELSSESSRDLFSQFILDWNSEKLDPRYYEGIAAGPRTAHKWKIKQ
ncbi:style cell-cycle inhibitor 1-A [Diospyros lotus]|uniref:style cell-cycle inhibitor 1-A n=1 Tax=Diospyros lotus TaxID=55363 RepID=UPI00224D3ED9|nr:style cell-cycle inhibitor 1-A [Diospyros lotus]